MTEAQKPTRRQGRFEDGYIEEHPAYVTGAIQRAGLAALTSADDPHTILSLDTQGDTEPWMT